MPELDELLAIDTSDVSDDDFVLIFDNSAPTSKSKKASRTNLLKGSRVRVVIIISPPPKLPT